MKEKINREIKVSNYEYAFFLNIFGQDEQYKGFRKGKIPINILEGRIGDRVINYIIDYALKNLIESESNEYDIEKESISISKRDQLEDGYRYIFDVSFEAIKKNVDGNVPTEVNNVEENKQIENDVVDSNKEANE